MNLKKYITRINFALAALLSIVCCSSAYAQSVYSDISIENYTPNFELINSGLVSKNIRCLAEDRDGYIWLGTLNGMARYDGIDMLTFFTTDVVRPSKTGRSSNLINRIYYDEQDNNVYGLFLNKPQIAIIDLDTYEQRLLAYDLHDTTSNVIQSNVISSVYNYNDSLLLGICSGNIYLINKNNGHTTFAYKCENTRGRVASEFIERENTIYCIAGEKLQAISRGYAPHELSVKGVKTTLADKDRLKGLCEYSDSSVLLLSTYNQTYSIYEYVFETKTTSHIFSSEGIPYSVIADGDIIRVVTPKNLQIFDKRNNGIYIYNTINSNLIDNGLLYGIRSKHQPIYWYGSDEGLIKENYYLSKLKLFDMRRISESVSCDVYSVYKDRNGDLWGWCIDGLFRKKPGEYLMKKYDYSQFNIGKAFLSSTIEDSVHNQLYFCYYNAVVVHDLQTGEDRILTKPRVDKSRFLGAKMLSDHRILFVGTQELTYYDTQRHTIIYDDVLYNYPGSKVVELLSFDIEGDSIMWLCNKGDILKYNLNTKELQKVLNVMPAGSGYALRYAYRNGIRELWLATSSDGLIYILPDIGKFKHIDYSQYTLGSVYSIEIDKDENVWVACADAIVCINNKNGNTYEFPPVRYGYSTQFRKNSSSQSLDGQLFFGGTNTILQVNPQEFATNKYSPKPIVTSYRYVNATNYYYDHIIQRDNICTSDTIVVPKGIRSLILNIHVLNYDDPKNNKMAWRQKSDDPWQVASASVPFVLTELSYGYNSIEFATINETGFPSKEVLKIWVKKEVFIYENPLFQGFVVIFIIVMIYLALYLHSQKVKRDKLTLQQEVKEQAGLIIDANEKLKQSQQLIEQRNKELQRSHDDLEREVQQRTEELNQALMKAEENSKLKSAFLANLSHEVRTPMNCIVGFSKLLADPLCTRADQLEFSQLIQDSSKSLMTLISDLLDVSRIESGQLRVNFDKFDVSKALENVYKALIVERKYQDVAFELLMDDAVDGLIINSDYERFRQIIINITYNAFKFTKEGHVTISAAVTTANQLRRKYFYPISAPDVTIKSKLLIVSIEDTGIGVPSDKMDEIFEPFRKLSNNKTHYPGLGLGLNIVKNLMKHLHGEIWLTSELNKGTTFYFYLPI